MTNLLKISKYASKLNDKIFMNKSKYNATYKRPKNSSNVVKLNTIELFMVAFPYFSSFDLSDMTHLYDNKVEIYQLTFNSNILFKLI